MAFDGGSDGKVRRQRAMTTTARIELKWRTADGGIGGCRYCCCRSLSSGSNGKARRQQAMSTTARIELKRWTADGGIGGCRYCCRRPSSSLIDDVFASFDRGHRHRGLVISLPPSSWRGGAPPNPDGNKNNEDEGNNDKDNDKDDDKDNNKENKDDNKQCR